MIDHNEIERLCAIKNDANNKIIEQLQHGDCYGKTCKSGKKCVDFVNVSSHGEKDWHCMNCGGTRNDI